MQVGNSQSVAGEWVTFQGGELEGRRPKVLCRACRQALKDLAVGAERRQEPRALCFQCYRAELERERGIKAAGLLDTASEERFQTMLPLEPVNIQRLQMLKADREVAREAEKQGIGQFVDKRRRAQIAARHALQRVFAGVAAKKAAHTPEGERVIASAFHAAELQLPEAWLPFVVAR